MGVDFIRQRAKTFRKSWDNHKIELSRRTLFTQEPDCLARGAAARIVGPRPLITGERVLVRVDGDRLVAVQDMAVRAIFLEPPLSLMDLIRSTGGYADGEVCAVNTTGDLVEVTVC
jgi:hypothetical protein